MIFQRGPWAFVDGTFQIVTRFGTDGSPFPHLSHSAAETISANIAVLKSLQSCLATFLAEVSTLQKFSSFIRSSPSDCIIILTNFLHLPITF